MKKQFTLILLAIFALGKVSFSQNTIIIHDKQINQFAASIWETTSADLCVVTDVVVQTGQTKQTVNGGGQPFSSPFTVLNVTVADYCSLQYLYYATAVIWTGGDVANNLTSASVDTHIPLLDQVSGITSDAHIVLNWTSNSPMVTGQFFNQHVNLKGIHIGSDDHGIYRNCDITGSITVDGGANIIDPANPTLCYIIRGGPSDIINIHPRLANPAVDAMAAVSNSISLYPNPTSDVLHVNMANVSSYTMVDMLGAVVAARNTEGKTTEDIDLSNTPAGIYFLRLQTDQGLVVKKFVRE